MEVDYTPRNEALIQFFFYLLRRLRDMATVGALDVEEYAKSLTINVSPFTLLLSFPRDAYPAPPFPGHSSPNTLPPDAQALRG